MYCDPTSPFFDPFVDTNPKAETKALADTKPLVDTESFDDSNPKVDQTEQPGTKAKSKNTNKSFNPAAKPFSPTSVTMSETEQVEDVGRWQVVAAEFGGKAVAVLVVPGTDQVHVCTSPAFNSKCDHPGLSCLVWDSVVYDDPETRETSLASQSPLPLDNYVDSGYENMTDNSSEISGENFHLQQSLLTTVDYGYHQPELVFQTEPAYYQTVEIFTPSDGFEQQGLISPTSPLVQYVPWVSQDVPSPASWSSGLGIEVAGLTSALTNVELGGEFNGEQGLNEMEKKEIVSYTPTAEEVVDQEKIKESFKNQVLNNLRVDEDERDFEDNKKRRAFKKQVLSNLKNEGN